MTNHYTPDEEQVRAAYVEMEHFKSRGMSDREADSAEFDRFIAKVKADALREAADEYATSNREQTHGVTSVLMFMHHRADRIEREAGQAAALGDDDE